MSLDTGEDQESALETYFSDARQLFNALSVKILPD